MTKRLFALVAVALLGAGCATASRVANSTATTAQAATAQATTAPAAAAQATTAPAAAALVDLNAGRATTSGTFPPLATPTSPTTTTLSLVTGAGPTGPISPRLEAQMLAPEDEGGYYNIVPSLGTTDLGGGTTITTRLIPLTLTPMGQTTWAAQGSFESAGLAQTFRVAVVLRQAQVMDMIYLDSQTGGDPIFDSFPSALTAAFGKLA